MATTTANDLYSLLKVDRDSTIEEIHRAYKTLSATFHPDKLPPSSQHKREEIQEVFLQFKLASTYDILTDPVLRLAYDHYGGEGVDLIRRIRRQREQQNRKAAAADLEGEESDEEDEDESNLYERLERLMSTNPVQAREELQQFIEQYEYHQRLVEENQVHLSCSMEFPPVIDLKNLFFDGRDYLKMVESSRSIQTHGLSPEERAYVKDRIKQERGLVDYQINRIRDSQKAEVGFTLSSVQQPTTNAMTGETPVPKWSMTMGGSSHRVYPDVQKIVLLAGKKEKDQEHPSSLFVNMLFQPVPDSQIYATANMSNDQANQFVLGSARTFANRSSFRYYITFLPTSPLESPLIFNFRSDRHIKDIGMTSGGLSVGGNGQVLQWNAKWDAANGPMNNHRYSAKVSMGMLQGNSLRVGYKYRFQKTSWLEEYFTVPKLAEFSAVMGRFPKIEGMITQEFSALATHPTLGFGMEHNLTLGCWTWIWEFTHQGSSFRVPIPVVHLGTVADPGAFYGRKLYYAIYCLIFQSMVADILQDDQKPVEEPQIKEAAAVASDLLTQKTKADAEKQLGMMKKVSERKRSVEADRHGLVIQKAAYWMQVADIGIRAQTTVFSMDATAQLQFWVAKGRLVLPSIPMSCWLGFYDLETESKVPSRKSRRDWRFWRRWTRRSIQPVPETPQPQLTIRYSFDGYVYEITVREKEAITLPSSKAQLLGHDSVVQ